MSPAFVFYGIAGCVTHLCVRKSSRLKNKEYKCATQQKLNSILAIWLKKNQTCFLFHQYCCMNTESQTEIIAVTMPPATSNGKCCAR